MDKSIGAVSNSIDKLVTCVAHQNEQRAEILEGLQALRALYKMLRSNPQLDPKTGQFLLDSRKEYNTAIEQKKKAISRLALQEEVNFDQSLLEIDLQITLRWGQALSLRAQDRAVYIIQSPKLQDWLLSTTNGILLINGNTPDLDANIHPTSFLSAHLVNSIAGTKKNMHCIYWFCSLHRNPRNDADTSVPSIVCSMIGQLLSKYQDFDLSFFHKRHLHGVRNKDITTLCNILDELILQLPNGTVLFCVLDWLSCIEDTTRRDDVRYLAERLCQVARTPGKRASMFKLLINNVGGPFRAASFVEKEEILNVPESVDGDTVGFSKLMWNLKVEEPVAELAKKKSSRPRSKGGEAQQ